MTYVVKRYKGEYLEYEDKTSCGYTYLNDCAMTFDTYSKAYYIAKKLNKRYGRNVVSVSKFD